MSTIKNKLTDLNNHLFSALERLNDEDLIDEEKINIEVKKAKAITSVSKSIIDNAALMLDAQKYFNDMGEREKIPEMLYLSSREKQ